jgi:competence protein ComEC
MSTKTRFRAYQLGTAGSSFSYSVDNHFTLIEARLNETNAPHVVKEMKIAGCNTIDCLHITSWDQDHCNYEELKSILQYIKPKRIVYPGYVPHTDSGKNSLKAIISYCINNNASKSEVSPDYVNSLGAAEKFKYNDIIYNPIEESDNSNNNSIVQLFRGGRFTVLSLGDCEEVSIATRIMRCGIASSETDVLILAHHGADNGFTSKEFIQAIKPKIAVCSSNYDNMFDHPKQEIRNLLYQEGVTLYTTKTGDVVIICEEDNVVHAYNLKTNSEEISSKRTFEPKCTVSSD